MSIYINKTSRVLIQGITGRDGSFHARQMREYGTAVVAGVTPGKGGQKFDGEVPIFDTVADAVQATKANVSVIYVPPPFAADAMMEAADAGIPFIVCITEGVPVLDMTRVYPYVKERGSRLLGPNCPGLISPGQSTCVGIGGDPINGTSFIDVLEAFENDPKTRAIAMMGEIGGTDEQEAARFVHDKMKKPVIGFIAGQTAPPGRRMGHAGSIISGTAGSAAEKLEAFEKAGMGIARRPKDFVELLKARL